MKRSAKDGGWNASSNLPIFQLDFFTLAFLTVVRCVSTREHFDSCGSAPASPESQASQPTEDMGIAAQLLEGVDVIGPRIAGCYSPLARGNDT